jgi:hypothetical protein
MGRRSKISSIVAVTTLVAVAVAAGTANPIPRWAGSWADRNHIWEVRDAESYTREPLCDVRLCGTEDGAETWHPVFRPGGFPFVRTSPMAGAVRTATIEGTSAFYWTKDAGRHWYRTVRIGGRITRRTSSFQLAGNGPYLYWHRSRKLLYRVVPWPPTIEPQCLGEWKLDFITNGTPPPEGSWGAICVGPAEDAGMRSVVAKRLNKNSFWRDFVSIRHGIESLLYPIRRRRPRLFVLQDGRAHTFRLPRPPVWRNTLALKRYRLHRLGWPQIGVSASALGRNGPYPLDTIGCVI